MLRFLGRVLAVSAFAAIAAAPVTALAAGGGGGGASSGMTITIGSPITLQNRLLITVPVTVSCAGSVSIDPTLFPPGGIGVTVEQANGQAVSVGSGGAELDSCSPTPQTFVVQVTPAPGATGSLAFHGGPAIVSASGGICDFNFPQTCFSGGTAWQPTRL